MILKKRRFLLQSIAYADIIVNILLSSIDDGNVPPDERNDFVLQHVDAVGTGIHQIDLGEHSHRPMAVRIDGLGKFERIGIGQIGIGGSDCENNGIGIGNVRQTHFSNQVFNVVGLISHGHLGHSGQIDEGQRQDVGRINFQVNGSRVNALVASREAVRFSLNFVTNVLEIGKDAIGQVEKFSPLVWFVLGIDIFVISSSSSNEEEEVLYNCKTRGRRVTMP